MLSTSAASSADRSPAGAASLKNAEPMRFGRRNDVAGEEHVARRGHAGDVHQARHATPGRAVAEARLRKAEPAGLGSDADVAGERQLQAAAERGAFQHGHDRHGQVGQGLERAAAESGQAPGLARTDVRPLVEVGAGAEHRRGGTQDHERTASSRSRRLPPHREWPGAAPRRARFASPGRSSQRVRHPRVSVSTLRLVIVGPILRRC